MKTGGRLFSRLVCAAVAMVLALALQAAVAGPARAVLPGPGLAAVFKDRFQVAQTLATAKADDGARVAVEQWRDARTLDLGLASPITGQQLTWVRLLLPADWTRETDRTWSTLYLLHGGLADYTAYTKSSDVAELSSHSSAIIAIPDTSACSAFSDWYNGGQGGSPKWETFITTEIPQILERAYHASSERAVAGYSMGGQGALKLAASHPGFYRAAASYSANLNPLGTYTRSVQAGDTQTVALDNPGLICGKDLSAIWGNPSIPEQRKIWERNDPYIQAAGLAGTRVFLSSGDSKDFVEVATEPATLAMSKRLSSNDPPIPNTYCLFTGYSHNWDNWNRAMRASWPLLMSAIGATTDAGGADNQCTSR